jgi:large subunit ribosomal protein L17
MNKHVFGRKLSRSRPSREALFSSLIRALILSGKIETTRAKAKAIQGKVERALTLAKKATLSGRRRVLAELDNDRKVCDLLFQKIAPAFSGRNSGFTRIVSLPARRGDRAKMVRMEWVEKITFEAVKKESKDDKSKKETKKAEKSVAAKKSTSLKKPANPKS